MPYHNNVFTPKKVVQERIKQRRKRKVNARKQLKKFLKELRKGKLCCQINPCVVRDGMSLCLQCNDLLNKKEELVSRLL